MIIPIDGKNPDYYQWGVNCKLLGFTRKQAKGVIGYMKEGNSITKEEITQDQKDLFYSGFYSKD